MRSGDFGVTLQGWAASSELYELMITAACQLDVVQAKNILNRMQVKLP